MFQCTISMLVHQTQKWCCPLQPFQMRYFVFISDQKSCYFCATTGTENLQEANTMCYYSMWMLVHLTHLMLSSATLSNENFCVHFWSKMFLFLCVQQQQTGTHSATTGTENLLETNTMFYYFMWMLVHPTHLVLSSASPSNEIFYCCSFLI